MTPAAIAPPPPVPWGLPLLAAAAALLGPILGFTFFLSQLEKEPESEWGDPSPFSSLSSAWAEGGWPMYAVLAAAMMLALLTALFVLFASRGSAALAVATPLFAVIPAAIGAAGTSWGLEGSVLAVMHAHPDDRVTILCASAKEALQSTTFGACLSAGACAALALSLFLASRAQATSQRAAHRHALSLGSLVFGGFTLLSTLGAIASHKVGTTYGLVAYAAPGSGTEGLGELVAGFQRWQGLTAGAALALVIAAFLAGAVLRAPSPGRVAFVGSAVFSALLLFVSVRSKLSTSFQEAVAPPAPVAALFKFDAPVTPESLGPAVDEPFDADAAAHLSSQLRSFRDLHEAAGDVVDEATLALQPGVTAEGLARALRTVAEERYRSVTLLTSPTQRATSTLPPPFDLVRRGAHGLKLKLAFKEAACRDECTPATLNADTLTVGGETWPLERAATAQDDGNPIHLAAAPIEPAAFLAAIATAAKHERSLTLLFDGAAPAKPDDEWREPLEPTPPAPVAKADLLNVTAAGAHSLAQVKQALGASIGLLQGCSLEDTTLPTTVHVEFAVNAHGEVVTLVTDSREELGWCVRDVLERVKFQELDKAVLSLVRFDVKFTSLPKK